VFHSQKISLVSGYRYKYWLYTTETAANSELTLTYSYGTSLSEVGIADQSDIFFSSGCSNRNLERPCVQVPSSLHVGQNDGAYYSVSVPVAHALGIAGCILGDPVLGLDRLSFIAIAGGFDIVFLAVVAIGTSCCYESKLKAMLKKAKSKNKSNGKKKSKSDSSSSGGCCVSIPDDLAGQVKGKLQEGQNLVANASGQVQGLLQQGQNLVGGSSVLGGALGQAQGLVGNATTVVKDTLQQGQDFVGNAEQRIIGLVQPCSDSEGVGGFFGL
jgi:hypothetical protein